MASRKDVPSQTISPFGLRLQPQLKTRLEDAAEKSGRSLNAEISSRLSDSMSADHKTLRDEFAMAALAGLLAGSFTGKTLHDGLNGGFDATVLAYGYADRMIALRADRAGGRLETMAEQHHGAP